MTSLAPTISLNSVRDASSSDDPRVDRHPSGSESRRPSRREGLSPGQMVARRFHIKAPIGSGGTATVYRAHDIVTRRDVALKVRSQVKKAEELIEEAQVAAKLDHRNAIDVYVAGVDRRGAGFVAMELVDGPSLKEVMAAVGPMSERRTAMLALDICNALHELHQTGTVHCDIKPANLMMRRSDRSLVLIDFGLATRSGGPIDGEGISGTPSFLSPEQAMGMAVDARTDVYSLGCLIFTMLQGHTPFRATSTADALYKHIGAPVPRVERDRVSEAFKDLVESMMQKDPADRPPSMRCVAAILRRVLTRD